MCGGVAGVRNEAWIAAAVHPWCSFPDRVLDALQSPAIHTLRHTTTSSRSCTSFSSSFLLVSASSFLLLFLSIHYTSPSFILPCPRPRPCPSPSSSLLHRWLPITVRKRQRTRITCLAVSMPGGLWPWRTGGPCGTVSCEGGRRWRPCRDHGRRLRRRTCRSSTRDRRAGVGAGTVVEAGAMPACFRWLKGINRRISNSRTKVNTQLTA